MLFFCLSQYSSFPLGFFVSLWSTDRLYGFPILCSPLCVSVHDKNCWFSLSFIFSQLLFSFSPPFYSDTLPFLWFLDSSLFCVWTLFPLFLLCARETGTFSSFSFSFVFSVFFFFHTLSEYFLVTNYPSFFVTREQVLFLLSLSWFWSSFFSRTIIEFFDVHIQGVSEIYCFRRANRTYTI